MSPYLARVTIACPEECALAITRLMMDLSPDESVELSAKTNPLNFDFPISESEDVAQLQQRIGSVVRYKSLTPSKQIEVRIEFPDAMEVAE